MPKKARELAGQLGMKPNLFPKSVPSRDCQVKKSGDDQRKANK